MKSIGFMEVNPFGFGEVRPLGFGEMKPMELFFFLVDKRNETYFFSNIFVVDYGYAASGAKYHIR